MPYLVWYHPDQQCLTITKEGPEIFPHKWYAIAAIVWTP